jgi:SSS family solute:Na+ symporter
MAQNLWTAIITLGVNLMLTVAVSLVTEPKPENELVGLVYSLTELDRQKHTSWWQKPQALAVAVLFILIVLNLVFA